jgi:hypothetical protein
MVTFGQIWSHLLHPFGLTKTSPFIGKIKMATKMVPIVMPFNAAKANNATKQGSLTERER